MTVTDGIAAAEAEDWERAWASLRALPAETWAVHAADPFAKAGLTIDPATALREIGTLADAGPAWVPSAAWLALCRRVFGFGDQDLARRLWHRLDASVGSGEHDSRFVVTSRDWLQPWVESSADSPDADRPPPGTVSYALVGYGHPGRQRASANIGDPIQTLASLGHLLRHTGLTYTGEPDLVALADTLRQRVDPGLARHGVTARVQLTSVDRDASMYREIPPDTWILGFGWYMHPLFGMRCGFPLHKNLRPIFVSFHIADRSLLTPDAVEYLRRYGPIGCRDHTTVDLLLSAGVPAFFSGCITTTIRTLFPASGTPAPADARTAYVDMDDAPAGAVLYEHTSDAVRVRTLAENISAAVNLLDGYRANHRLVVTSRLHAYLPCRSIGLDVEFRPHHLTDPRFVGLEPLDDDAFSAMQDGIDALVEGVLSLALSGAPVDGVYARWREVTAPLVARARSRLASPTAMPGLTSSIVATVSTRQRHTPSRIPRDAIHVVVAADAQQLRAVREFVESIDLHATRPVHVWLLHRAGGFRTRSRPGSAVTVSAVDLGTIGHDLIRPNGSGLALADLARLIAADLLPDVDRLVFLPLESRFTDDLAALRDVDLAGRLAAAPDTPGTSLRRSGFRVIHNAARRLRETTLDDRGVRAAELRRGAHRSHAFDFPAFDVDVMVLDAAAARAAGLMRRLATSIETYGFGYRGALHAELGPERAVLSA